MHLNNKYIQAILNTTQLTHLAHDPFMTNNGNSLCPRRKPRCDDDPHNSSGTRSVLLLGMNKVRKIYTGQ